jgi:D-cysteine desulfhydrase family pyridoxal phosphate-dependent enzyme
MLIREPFAHLPTRIENLPRLSELLAGPEIKIKRDDQTGLALGGNKIRKLEYLIGQALSEGADLVLTTGAAQSNHCRQTAAAAARCGLQCILVLVGPKPEQPSANLLLDQLLGAEIVWTEKELRDQDLQKAFQNAKERGKKPYLIPYGGSNAIGAYGYFAAINELVEQIPDELPDWIVFATSSGGTQAGLVAGAHYYGLASAILGISVDEPKTILTSRIYQLVTEISQVIGKQIDLNPDSILVNDDYVGRGYGVFNAKDREAIHLFASTEGILLDPVYSGRAAAGLINLIRTGFFTKYDKVLFWHTGGIPALFADRYLPALKL